MGELPARFDRVASDPAEGGIEGGPGDPPDAGMSAVAPDQVTLLRRAYQLFNDRRIGELLALMTDDVAWPDVANGRVLHGKEAIRSYWEAQFAVANPQVDPIEFKPVGEDVVAVVDQRVLDGQGRITTEAVVFHRYTFTLGLIARMVVFAGPEEAFASD
jgi:ketosteroid isomerase-like protein